MIDMDRKELIEELVRRDIVTMSQEALLILVENYITESYEGMPTSQLEDILQSYKDTDELVVENPKEQHHG